MAAVARPKLSELIARFGGRQLGMGDPEIEGLAPIEEAQAPHLSFLANPKYRSHLAQTKAAAVIVGDADAAHVPEGLVAWVADNPYATFARLSQWFAERLAAPVRWGIDASASVDATASVHPECEIGPHAVIGAGSTIERGARIGAGCILGCGVRIGENTRLHARVVVYDACIVGQRCIVHSGAVIGADGFGFAPDAGAWVKIAQTGRVLIGDDVEIGANTTIDRGAMADTVIEDGVKLDNQIQIAHNCRIGANTIIAACVGIAGSTTIGKRCMIGGAALIIGHITICDGASVSAGTFISRAIRTPGHYTGVFPMDEHSKWERNAVLIRRLDQIHDRLKRLEKSRPNEEEPS